MSWEKQCEEKGCKNLATHKIHVVLISRPIVPKETSGALGYVCDEHKGQTMDEFISEDIWTKLVLQFRRDGKVPPVRTVSYLVIKPFQQPKYV